VQSANEAKSEFVSAAAHELKNPLTSIKGYSDLLVSGSVGPISEGQAEFLRTIRANAERMRTLVSDLQDISRIEANQLHVQVSEESLSELIHEVVTSFESQIADKQQSIEVQIADNLPHIRCDNTRMVQILTNLVSNAHKYSPENGQIVITACEMANSGRSERDQPAVQISITDNGYGISVQDQERIFEQFFRSEDSHIRESTGTGLGLSITRKLVELQGGKLWFESEIGTGTTFHFTIPITEQENNQD
jgi:signal transduction histidine kinase